MCIITRWKCIVITFLIHFLILLTMVCYICNKHICSWYEKGEWPTFVRRTLFQFHELHWNLNEGHGHTIGRSNEWDKENRLGKSRLKKFCEMNPIWSVELIVWYAKMRCFYILYWTLYRQQKIQFPHYIS